MAKPIVISHFPCADGFTAAWIARKALGDVEFVNGKYGESPPDVTGRVVYIFDFAYPADVLLKMAETAGKIVVRDHHKSAREDLLSVSHPRLDIEFDMERSGARMAWDYFFPSSPPPIGVKHVEDRDLWRFAVPNTREYSSAMFSYEYTFENWDYLMDQQNYESLVIEGKAIERKHLKDVNELVAQTQRIMCIGGRGIPTANVPYQFASDAGNILSEGKPFAATYYDSATHRHFSLRSSDGGEDVSIIAKRYGGGGHAKAAGFRVPLGWEGDF